jgi:hypothetical protein
MKLNGTLPNRKVIFRDNIRGIGYSEISNPKHQISMKSKIPISNDPNSLKVHRSPFRVEGLKSFLETLNL